MFEVLLKYSSSSPIILFLCKTQYPSSQNSDFGDISLHRHKKIILAFFFSCDFTIVTADISTYYTVCLLFSGPQAKFSWVFQVWNSKVVFYNKTTCLLRRGCFNRDLFSIITPCFQGSVSYYIATIKNRFCLVYRNSLPFKLFRKQVVFKLSEKTLKCRGSLKNTSDWTWQKLIKNAELWFNC